MYLSGSMDLSHKFMSQSDTNKSEKIPREITGIIWKLFLTTVDGGLTEITGIIWELFFI